MRINLPCVGQSYQHPDVPLSAQTTKNWFPEINTETTVILSLQPFPGAKAFSAGTGVDRGMTVWQKQLYKVTDTTLYRIDVLGAQTSIGTIDGTGRCTFPSSTDFMVIVSSGKAYKFDGTTLTEITDVDLEQPKYGTYLNQQWIYQGAKARFAVSDVAQPDQINGLNYASAESEGDDLVRPYVFNQVFYLFGERNIEPWYNSGVGRPPFDRIDGGIVQKGLGAADSVSSNDTFMYFLGDDRYIYQMSGSNVQSISSIPLASKFAEYDSIDDAVGFCFSYQGQQFYQLTVGGDTWCYNQNAGGWFELTYGSNELPQPTTSAINCYGKLLIANGGKVLEVDRETETYDGEPLIRERTSGLISGDLFQTPDAIGRRLFMHRLDIVIKGIPAINERPKIMLSWSDDAGFTFSNERIIECGELGNYTFQAKTEQLGSFFQRVIKIRISDDSRYSLHRVTGDIDIGT